MERAFCALGDRLTAALVRGDFAAYRDVMALPLTIAPRGGTAYVLTTETALAQDFDLYVASIRAAGVTDIFREVLEATQMENGQIRVRFMVHFLDRSHRLADPFLSEMLLVPSEQGLKIREIISAADHIDWTLGRGQLGPGSGLI